MSTPQSLWVARFAAALHRLPAGLSMTGLFVTGLCMTGLFTTDLCAQADPATPSPRILTSRQHGRGLLRLPKEDDAFGFIVFGDRTGGPAEGIEVLKQAVADTNLLDPDLVLTVGDLINGYNTTEPWMAQAKEYKDAMAKLRMPWFPVAGNHDIYWRGPGKPRGEHEQHYETVFGPLWYAVQHKRCWFVVLYSDEGNPETGEKNFNKPECQRISEEQFAWLQDTLQRARQARHVFVFLHHPRWLKQYGDDWQRVHRLLASNGNVRAVFAGHIHHMRFGGVRDGIEYYTVASVGAHLGMDAPEAGFLHQYHVVTVRPEGIKVAAVPVGGVIDPQQLTDEIADDAMAIHRGLQAKVDSVVPAGDGPAVRMDGSVDAVLTLSFRNDGNRAIELEVIPQDLAPWRFGPDHQHLVVPRRSTGRTTFAVQRAASREPFALPTLEVRCDYLAKDRRIALPTRTATIDLPPPDGLGATAAEHNGVLVCDGSGCLQVPDARLQLPDGPFTLECWLNGDDFTGRRGLLAKTENSEFGIFVSDATVDFSVHLGRRYVSARSGTAVLRAGTWHHIAGVYDGREVRVYVDGRLLAKTAGSGKRTRNKLPFLIGADVDRRGRPTSFFAGRIDDVRLSQTARYQGERFAPPDRLDPDDDTVLLVPCDRTFGPWAIDRSPRHSHPRRIGNAYCTVEKRASVR